MKRRKRRLLVLWLFAVLWFQLTLVPTAYAHNCAQTIQGLLNPNFPPQALVEDCLRTGYAQGIITALIGVFAGGLIARQVGQGLADARGIEAKSEHPECDQLYARLRDAVRRYGEAQRARDAVAKRLERARRIHMANQVKLMVRTGIEVGGVTASGVEGVHGAGRTLGRGADDFADELKRGQARADMLAEPARQIRSRLAQIEQAIEGLSEAQSTVNRLLQEQADLESWYRDEWRQHMGKHPGIPADIGDPIALDAAEIETNAAARRGILDDIARQGFATPAQQADLAELLEKGRAAQQRQLQRQAEAIGKGWIPDLETQLQRSDPAKYQRLMEIDNEISAAQRHLADAEQAAPAGLIDKRNQLREQLKAMLDAEAEGSLPEGLTGKRTGTQQAARPDDAKRGGGTQQAQRGGGTQQPSSSAPQPPAGGSTYSVPEPPEWARVIREGLGDTIADILSPFTRAFRWAFVGKDQSPEEIGRILRQGMDTIDRLTREFDDRQRGVDDIRGEVARMREDLERCNASRRQ